MHVLFLSKGAIQASTLLQVLLIQIILLAKLAPNMALAVIVLLIVRYILDHLVILLNQ